MNGFEEAPVTKKGRTVLIHYTPTPTINLHLEGYQEYNGHKIHRTEQSKAMESRSDNAIYGLTPGTPLTNIDQLNSSMDK